MPGCFPKFFQFHNTFSGCRKVCHQPGEKRECRFVFIGRNLQRVEIAEGDGLEAGGRRTEALQIFFAPARRERVRLLPTLEPALAPSPGA